VTGDDPRQSINRVPVGMARDARGQIYVLHDVVPRVFDSTGRFVRDIGRRGSGPGEVQAVSAVAPAGGDTVAFWDATLRRLSYFDGNGRFLKETRLFAGPALWFAFVPGERIVARGRLAPDHPRARAHVLSRSGKVLLSFADDRSTIEETLAITIGAGHVFVVDAFARVFQEYDFAGNLKDRFAIKSDWFDAADHAEPVRPGGPPPRMVTQRIDVDAAGRLWVFTLVPRPDWERGLRRAPSGRGYIEDVARARQTRIEVLDPTRHRVLATITVPHIQLIPLGNGYLGAYGESADADPELTVLRYSFSER
jgi:hypothetical protein